MNIRDVKGEERERKREASVAGYERF